MGKQIIELEGKTILVTGSPGFIGANLVIRLLSTLKSGTVISFDSMNDYYAFSNVSVYYYDDNDILCIFGCS